MAICRCCAIFLPSGPIMFTLIINKIPCVSQTRINNELFSKPRETRGQFSFHVIVVKEANGSCCWTMWRSYRIVILRHFLPNKIMYCTLNAPQVSVHQLWWQCRIVTFCFILSGQDHSQKFILLPLRLLNNSLGSAIIYLLLCCSNPFFFFCGTQN